MSDPSCCPQCHFRWEERHVVPFLPLDVRLRLDREHAELAVAGYPYDPVEGHATWEETVFRPYLPPAIYGELVRQHRALAPRLKAGKTS